jgi:hypothetical protein
MHVKKHEHITPVLQELHWLPVEHRCIFKFLILTYKCFNNQAPQYLSNLLDVHRPVRNLRSSSEGFIQPRRYKTEFYGARAFQVAAPRLWNALPLSVWGTGSLDAFNKAAAKTHLFKQCFIA